MKTKEKIFTQIQPVFLPRFFAQIPKGSAMAQFWVLFWVIQTLLATQGGGAMAQCPPP